MSKSLSYILISLFFISLSTYAMANQEATSFESFTGSIVGERVRLRTQPNLEGYVVRETAYGELFEIVAEEHDYYAVVPPSGMRGFIFRTFVLDDMVEGERVNIRLYPDIEASVIGRLNTGDRVEAVVSDINDKWLEIVLPKNCCFYVAKEYIENKGPAELLAQIEEKRHEGSHHLSSALLFAQAQIQKPFEQIDFDEVSQKFITLIEDYADLPEIAEPAQEASSLIQDIYVQKKVAFLQSKAEKTAKLVQIDPTQLEQLAKLGIEFKPDQEEDFLAKMGKAASNTIGLASTMNDEAITDKMRLWEPIEESLYHLWAASNKESTLEDFYKEETESTHVLTGIVESYDRPVKNKPGDFLLRTNSLPVAFLYSTKINLQNLVGQEVTVSVSSRSSHNFAFPAYYVLSVE